VDPRIEECRNVSPHDRQRLAAVEAGLVLTADVCRADLLLCCLVEDDRALVARHVAPASAASLYPEAATGSVVDGNEQPLVLRVLHGGRGGRLERETKGSRAPVIQDVYPVRNDGGAVIGALAIEFNMFAFERHRRRSRVFRDAVRALLHMCARGDLECAQNLSRFGLYDGIYLVDRSRTILYMSGIAGNLFRSAGIAVDVEGQPVSELEPMDAAITDEVFAIGRCVEHREETPDGRVWVRKGVPLRTGTDEAPLGGARAFWRTLLRGRERDGVDSVLVLLHNATEAVQKQRELNVKSAIIQEVHHRVKNNLQSVAAILRIQARRAQNEETQQQLTEAVNRILSVAVIHEFLSEDENRPINIRDLADRVAAQVGHVTGSPDQEIDIQVQGPRIRLPAGQATPVAMVINELMLNALEHGLQGHRKGTIEIVLEDLGQSVRVSVENTGSSLPPDFDPQQDGSLGLQIVHTLVADDLKGELTIESLPDGTADGQERVVSTRAVVTFPKRPLKVD
jgi:two-component system, sensor histidine kinase PdtaS